MDWPFLGYMLKRKAGKLARIKKWKSPVTKTLPSDQSAALIENLLLSDAPVMICRWGSVEQVFALECLHIKNHLTTQVSTTRFQEFCLNAGFFPADPKLAYHCASLLLERAADADCIAAWNTSLLPWEHYILHHYSPHAQYIPLCSISPCENTPPWSRVLQGKKVVVVHPFAESIEEQYQRRELLFNNQEVLPLFELHTIKAVQSIYGEPTPFTTWFDALASMERQLDAIDYDIALIGAGAYGMPLASHVKRSGKKAVHIGGALQLLFGIMGKRWLDYKTILGMCSENWVFPKQSEHPKNYSNVEGGCYW